MRWLLVIPTLVVLVSAPSVARQAGSRAPAEWPAGLMRLDVMASDAGGKPVPGLAQGDFEIVSDGQPLSIAHFSGNPSPVTVAVLVDVTASLHPNPAGVAGLASGTRVGAGVKLASPNFPELIAPAVEEFAIKGLRADDRVRVAAITRRPTLGPLVAGTSKAFEAQWKALFDLPPIEWLGPSPIWDAVADAAAWCAGEPGHRAVILMSDGLASGNVKSHLEVAAQAALTGVSISVIAEASVPRQLVEAGRDPAKPLRTLADATGGAYVFDSPASYRGQLGEGSGWKVRQRTESFQLVLDHLHHAYALGFVPVADGKLHRLEVRVKKAGVTVQARRGYVAGAGARF